MRSHADHAEAGRLDSHNPTMRLGFAVLALAAAARPAAAFTIPQSTSSVQRATAAFNIFAPSTDSVTSTALRMSTAVDADPQVTIDEALKAAGSGVTLFGKSGCPFCKKTKKALYFIGVHPTIVELDEVEGGAAIQKKLVREDLILRFADSYLRALSFVNLIIFLRFHRKNSRASPPCQMSGLTGSSSADPRKSSLELMMVCSTPSRRRKSF